MTAKPQVRCFAANRYLDSCTVFVLCGNCLRSFDAATNRNWQSSINPEWVKANRCELTHAQALAAVAGCPEQVRVMRELLGVDSTSPTATSLIYLASPYSHPDPAESERRFHAVCKASARLMSAGHLIFSPIAHTHPIAISGQLPTDWEFWKKYDHAMLDAAAELWVLRLPGWDKSKGVAGEIEYMQAHGKPVRYLDPLPEDVVANHSPPAATSDPPAPAFRDTMTVCEACGNKRCPHAADKQMACTGSNEPGQVPTPQAGAELPDCTRQFRKWLGAAQYASIIAAKRDAADFIEAGFFGGGKRCESVRQSFRFIGG